MAATASDRHDTGRRGCWWQAGHTGTKEVSREPVPPIRKALTVQYTSVPDPRAACHPPPATWADLIRKSLENLMRAREGRHSY